MTTDKIKFLTVPELLEEMEEFGGTVPGHYVFRSTYDRAYPGNLLSCDKEWWPDNYVASIVHDEFDLVSIEEIFCS